MENVMAFAGLPLAFLLTASGLGLLVERLARVELDNALLAPVGFCAATSLLLTVFKVGGHVEAAVAILVVASVAGYGLARRDVGRVVMLGPAGVAGLAVYLLYVLPLIGAGGWTWLGYNFLNDTAVQFLLVEHLKDAGTDSGALPMTTGGESLRTYLASGYPLGAHSYAAGLSGLVAQPIEVLYQAYLAAMAAMAAMALAVLGRAITNAWTGAALGAVALTSNLAVQYAWQGSIKEIGVLAALCVSIAVAAALPRSSSPMRLAVVLGVCMAGVLSTYNAAGGPYLAAIGAALAVVVVTVHGRSAFSRQWVLAGAVILGVGAVASAAALTTIREFYDVASAVVDSSDAAGSEFGVLADRMGLLQSSGVYLDGRYFEPIADGERRETLTAVASWVIVALLLCAGGEAYRRRRPEALLALVPLAVTTALVAPRVTPYADAKLLAILSPAVVFTAGVGLLLVWRYARPAALALGAALLVAVGISDAFAYHDAKPAPTERMLALQDVAGRGSGEGLILLNEFEEFGKYFDPDDRINVAAESITPRPVALRVDRSRFGRHFDLDQHKLDYVTGFDEIILRRSPSASRPPATFRKRYENRHYELWARRGPAGRVVAHLPLGGSPASNSERARCADVRRLARRAERSGGRLVASVPREAALFEPVGAPMRSSGWPIDGNVPGGVTISVPGQAQGTITVRRAGELLVRVRGSLPRAATIEVDGRVVGEAYGVNTPGQWLPVATVSLSPGTHSVKASVPGGNLEPGDGALGVLGPVAFVRPGPERLETVAPDEASSLCGRTLDWIEIVR